MARQFQQKNRREHLDVNIARPQVNTQTTRVQAPVNNDAANFMATLNKAHKIAGHYNAEAEKEDNQKAKAAALAGEDFQAEYRSSEENFEKIRLATNANTANQDWYQFKAENAADFEDKDANTISEEYEAFMRERFSGMEDPHELETLNEIIAKTKARVRGDAIKEDVELLNQERMQVADEYITQLVTNDPKGFSLAEINKGLSGNFELFTESGKKVKLTSDQREAVLVQSLTRAAVANRNPDILNVLSEKQPNGSPAISKNPRYAKAIEKARVEADRHRMLNIQYSIDKEADNGTFSLALGHQALEAGVPYAFVLSNLNRNLRGNADKIEHEDILGLLNSGEAILHKEPSKVQKVVDSVFDAGFKERDANKMLAAVKQAATNGYVPTQAKKLMESITPNSNPQMLETARSFYNELNQHENKLALAKLNNESAATFSYLNTAIEFGGLTPEVALANLNEKNDKFTKISLFSEEGKQALQNAIGNVKDFPWTTDSIESNPYLEKTLTDLVKVGLGFGYSDVGQATEWAVERLHSTHDEVNGRLIPRTMFPQMKNIEDGLIDYVENSLKLDVDEYDIRVPHDFRQTGEVVIAPKNSLFPNSSHRHKAYSINKWHSDKSKTEHEKAKAEEREKLTTSLKLDAFNQFLKDTKTSSLYDLDTAYKEYEALDEKGKEKWMEKAINEFNLKQSKSKRSSEEARRAFIERASEPDFLRSIN